ncbi:MAG TPA: hypothetical protein PKK10_10220 [Woeseiaceae bacterium]|nr:hypothetical protein [Woeseiaceae bacterium]
MHKSIAILLFTLAFTGGARAATEVRVLATYPAGNPVTLASNQTFYLHIAYTTDEPVRIWARPFYRGQEVTAGSNPSRSYTGSGETLGWFFFMEPGQQVDEIRITAGDGTRLIATYAVRITGSDRPAASTSKPDWLVTLSEREERLQREDFEKRASTPVTVGDMVLFGGFMLAVLALGIGGIAGPLWAIRRWRGGWRVAAAVPVVMMLFVVLRIVVDTAGDPTSHNLWPFEILQVGALSLVVIGVLLAARKFFGAET